MSPTCGNCSQKGSQSVPTARPSAEGMEGTSCKAVDGTSTCGYSEIFYGKPVRSTAINPPAVLTFMNVR